MRVMRSILILAMVSGHALAVEDESVSVHPGRAAVEMVGALAVGTAWYYRNLDFNSRDWDLHWDWPSWRRKLTFDAVRFDSNDFETNAVGHSRAGTIYYQIARGNGLGAPGALAADLAATLTWEFFGEYREMVSINDIGVNTIGGFTIGEPLFQLGLFFRRSAPNQMNGALAAMFAPALAVNDWVSPEKRPPADAVDDWGFSRERWHRLALSVGAGNGYLDEQNTGTHALLGLDSELVMHRGFARAGRRNDWVGPGGWSSIVTWARFGRGGVPAGEFRTSTLVVGRLLQDLGPTGRGGWALIGLGSGFEYWRREWAQSSPDFLARLGVLGPHVELGARKGPFLVRLVGDAVFDLAMVRALGLDGTGGTRFDPTTARGTLRDHGYYFGLGYTASARLTAEVANLDLGAAVQWDHFSSVEGHDRYQEEIADDLHLVDERLALRGTFGFRPYGSPLRFGLTGERTMRYGRLAGFGFERVEFIGTTTAGLTF